MPIDGFVEYGEASVRLVISCRCNCFSISDTQPISLDV